MNGRSEGKTRKNAQAKYGGSNIADVLAMLTVTPT